MCARCGHREDEHEELAKPEDRMCYAEIVPGWSFCRCEAFVPQTST